MFLVGEVSSTPRPVDIFLDNSRFSLAQFHSYNKTISVFLRIRIDNTININI